MKAKVEKASMELVGRVEVRLLRDRMVVRIEIFGRFILLFWADVMCRALYIYIYRFREGNVQAR